MRTIANRTVGGRAGGTPPANGPGYNTVRNGTGDFRVNFTPPFRGPVGVAATFDGAVGSGTFQVMTSAITPDGFRALTFVNGTISDGAFDFVATGAI